MQVMTLNGSVLLGQMNVTSTALAPAAGDPTMPGENQVPLGNPGTGIGTGNEDEPMPAHIEAGGPAALAAPAPTTESGSAMTGEPGSTGTTTGEPQTMYSVPLQGQS